MVSEAEDLVDLAEDFSEDLILEILVIFFHRFSVEGWVEVVDHDHGSELISVRISRCDYGYRWRMQSDEQLARSSSTVL